MPFFKDLYDEQIPEMSSDFEASSFHTKAMLAKSGRDGTQIDDLGSRDADAYIMGSYVRNTDLNLRNSYNPGVKASQTDSQKKSQIRATNVTGKAYGVGAVKYEREDRATLMSIEEDDEGYARRKNNQSTVNKSSSDEGNEGVTPKKVYDDGKDGGKLIISTERGTYVPVPGAALEGSSRKNRFRNTAVGSGRKPYKRSSSFEEAPRSTLIQELLQGIPIREEKQEEDRGEKEDDMSSHAISSD